MLVEHGMKLFGQPLGYTQVRDTEAATRGTL